jgi:uncharacterized membrane protein YidH (DUF202 family)
MRHVGKPLGATFLGICKSFYPSHVQDVKTVSMGANPISPAILILLLGFHRYFESQHFIIRGKFPASRGSIVLVSLVTFALIVASLVVVVAVAPTAFEKK